MVPNILRSQVKQAVLSGEPFDMEFITADRRRGTGGDLIPVRGWQLRAPVQEISSSNEPGTAAVHEGLSGREKAPNHREHGTFNIFNPANAAEHIHKVHFDLVQTFNGRRVMNG